MRSFPCLVSLLLLLASPELGRSLPHPQAGEGDIIDEVICPVGRQCKSPNQCVDSVALQVDFPVPRQHAAE